MKEGLYPPLTTMSGVTAVGEWLRRFKVNADGLVVVLDPDEPSASGINMPLRLEQFLLDLRLLRRVPLCYLVPDADLLPSESIRFFNVDLNWVERVIDGVLSVGITDTTESMSRIEMLPHVRRHLDGLVGQIAQKQVENHWMPTGPVTGLLIRSELVRRWPDLIVSGFEDPQPVEEEERPVAVLRSEAISRDLHIALFAGQPRRVEIREPFKGARFGVEPKDTGSSPPKYEVDGRDVHGLPMMENGKAVKIPVDVHQESRVIDVNGLAEALLPLQGGTPRGVALHLEQRAFVQEFKDSVPETRGSEPLPAEGSTMPLRKGRVLDLTELRQRHQRQLDLGGA